MNIGKCELNVSQLHIVRAIACLGVVVAHAKFILWSGGSAYLSHYPMTQWAWHEFPLFALDLLTSLGVARVFFFFILSGFFLQHSARRGFAVGAFLRTRFWRLYPPYVAATLVSVAVFYGSLTYINAGLATASGREFNQLLLHAAHDLSWTGLAHTLLFMKRDVAFAASAHFWSMLHEVLFCLLFPLYRRLPVAGRAGLAGLLLVVGWGCGSLLLQAQLFFVLGMLFHDIFSYGYRVPWRLPVAGCGLIFAGLYLLTYALSKAGWLGLACLPLALLAFLLLDFFLTRTVRVPRLLAAISKASYAIYLNHMWALLLYYAVLSRLTGELVYHSRWPYYSGVLVALLLSAPFYRLIDRRIAAGQRRQYLPPAPQAVVARLPLPQAAVPAVRRPAMVQEQSVAA
jgi:peptidoglycan/LPS O-acetylase OafA/YrhL